VHYSRHEIGDAGSLGRDMLDLVVSSRIHDDGSGEDEAQMVILEQILDDWNVADAHHRRRGLGSGVCQVNSYDGVDPCPSLS